MSMFNSCRLLFDHFQFVLIHGLNIPVSYAIFFFTGSDFTSITSHIHNWVLFLPWLRLFILSGVFLHWSPVANWAPTDLGSSSFSVLFFFCLFILSIPLKSDWLYSLQSKMEKLYTVSKNRTGTLLWLRPWTPYCQIQAEIEESRENH